MIRKGVIVAAGRGSRLKPITNAYPKELIPIAGKPVIEYCIDLLKVAGITNILIVTGWRKGALQDYLRDGSSFGVNITYAFQRASKGLPNAIHQAKNFTNGDDFVVVNGDNFFQPSSSLLNAIEQHDRTRSHVTLTLYGVKDPTQLGIAKIDDEGKVIKMIEKPTWEQAEEYKKNEEYLIQTGCYVLSSEVFKFIEQTPFNNKGEQFLPETFELMQKSGLLITSTTHKGMWNDVGTWKAYLELEKEMITKIDITKTIMEREGLKEESDMHD
ncbi:MAG: nucleotidyltransferase family protein [Nanoarchaeota archaeon]|nr:nucleotidyltransferase family protein [Nanoarchaeota archaeon]